AGALPFPLAQQQSTRAAINANRIRAFITALASAENGHCAAQIQEGGQVALSHARQSSGTSMQSQARSTLQRFGDGVPCQDPTRPISAAASVFYSSEEVVVDSSWREFPRPRREAVDACRHRLGNHRW